MKWLAFLVSVSLFAGSFDHITPSTPDEIASLNQDLVVGGFISALSGQVSLSETDLRVKSAQDLYLTRTYIPPQILGRYHDREKRDKGELGQALLQLESKGWVVLPHLFAGYNFHSPHFQVRDPRGYVLAFSIEGTKGVLQTSSHGCTNLQGALPNSKADLRNISLEVDQNRAVLSLPDGTKRIYCALSAYQYRLDKELLPNGKAIRYQYSDQGMVKIYATDQSGRHIYGSIEQIGPGHYRGSDGNELKLHYQTYEIKGELKDERGKLQTKAFFGVMNFAENPFYSNKIEYNHRACLSSYDGPNYPISCNYLEKLGELCRVKELVTPTNTTHFSYDPPVVGSKGGSTTVTHPNGSQTIYRFSEQLLLTHIENRLNGKLFNQKVFSYDKKQHVSKIEIKDGQGQALLTTLYECDRFGNPILETVIGDFGNFSIARTFSQNRLTSEIRDDGLSFFYTYLEDTHLLCSKTTLINNEPLRKTLYFYDDAKNLIRKEGKTIREYILYTQGPNLHRVKWENHKDQKGRLIHKTHYFYDQYGNVSKEEHYGSDDAFAYAIHKEYDAKGNLLKKTNPLGQTATYSYDIRNRLTSETPFPQNLTVERTFDAKGRLISLKENEHITSFSYNSSDLLTEKTDYLSLTTKYQYHPVHNLPTQIESEPTVQKFSYDAFGRVILEEDAHGAVTQITYNSYNDPLEIVYPDGGVSTFRYAPNKTLLEEIDPDGLKTRYSYDPLGRITSLQKGSQTTTYFYDAFHLIEEIDPLNISTRYRYDLAGRKIEEQRANRVIKWEYDSLGFVSSLKREDSRTFFLNDPIGQVVEKNIDDLLKTSYRYDAAGNIVEIRSKDSRIFSYDPHNRLIEAVDEEGAKTIYIYEEGNQVLRKKRIDPRGVMQVETYNAHGKLLRREIPNATLEQFSYDDRLQLITQDHLRFTYTPEGRLLSMMQGDQKLTYWTYTPGGKIQSKTKPDGTKILYQYNADGRLSQMGSRSFSYDALGRLVQANGLKRELDPFGNIVKEELDTGLVIQSSYDSLDRPTQRTLPDGSTIQYEYNGPFLKKITRKGLNPGYLYTSEYEYSHTFDEYNHQGLVTKETGAFTTRYSYDKTGRRISQKTPHSLTTFQYDAVGNLIQKNKKHYAYNSASELIFEEGAFSKSYDQHHNCIEENQIPIPINDLNEREDFLFDPNGNLIKKGFVYDEFDQLIATDKSLFTYDALGRRLAADQIAYFYIGDEEIGSFESGKIQELKIAVDRRTIAIEKSQKPFAPITDSQNTIRELIDWYSNTPVLENTCDAFGKGITDEIPYAYAGKRCDSTGLIYFGQRFYDPSLARWLTPDPIGPYDHSNLYQYVYNNPYQYRDERGEFAFSVPLLVWGAELVLPAITSCITSIACGALTGIVAYGGYKFVEAINQPGYPRDFEISLYKDGKPKYTSDKPGSPPYNGQALGTDPTVAPGEGFEWRGKGKPGSSKGNWVKGDQDSREILHPDLDHSLPIGPHWDYQSPSFPKPGVRLYPDGTWEYK